MRSLNETPKVIIFSVYQSGLSETDNLSNHFNTLMMLESEGIEYKTMQGVYKGVSERSILVLNTQDNFDVVLKLTSFHNQESILISDENRDTQLLFLKTGQVESIGKLTEVSESEAKRHDAYTYDPIMEMYWIAK